MMPRTTSHNTAHGHRSDASKHVHHLAVESGAEFDQVVAYMPRMIAYGLVKTIEEAGEAACYDAGSQRAYFISRHGTTVNIWSWDGIRSAAEFAELLALIARLDVPLDLDQASNAYVAATGRR
jgi:hypothetical protein